MASTKPIVWAGLAAAALSLASASEPSLLGFAVQQAGGAQPVGRTLLRRPRGRPRVACCDGCGLAGADRGGRNRTAAASPIEGFPGVDPTHLLPLPVVLPNNAVERKAKIVTGGETPYVLGAKEVIANHQSFAKRHGYDYQVHEGNYAHPWIAYWHKIDVLLRELRAHHPAKLLVWMDLDVVVTDPTQDMLERILEAYPDQDVILTEDAQRGGEIPGVRGAKRRVNTGIILVRTGPQAVRVLEQLFQYGREHREAAYLPQEQDTLHEQDALDAMLGGRRQHVWSRHIAVIPQRQGALNLNTFARSYYDTAYRDPSDVEWYAGDFTAHCTGLRKQQREWCIADSISAAAERIAAEVACENETSATSGGSAAETDVPRVVV